MEDQILGFADQFSWMPNILRADYLPKNSDSFIVCGMGGSHLGARMILQHDPDLPISIHSNYGLPKIHSKLLQSSLIIASSYSGETEETLDAARCAIAAGLQVAVVTTGGTLARLAETHALPLILIPQKNLEPRMAVGASMLAIARLMRLAELEEKIRIAGAHLDTDKNRKRGEEIAKCIARAVPVIYSSEANAPLAYFWKIAINETSNIPSFQNIIPEVCHNEISGFDNIKTAEALSSLLHVLLLKDSDDDSRINKRMKIMRELFSARSVKTTEIELVGANRLDKSLNGILLGLWTAFALAKEYDSLLDAPTTIISEFKRKMLDT